MNTQPSLENWCRMFLKAGAGQKPSELARFIKTAGNIPAEQALDIYRNNTSGTRVRALTDIFPACCRILGERYFRQLLNGYLHDYPPQTSDLNEYGHDFCHFLEHQSGRYELSQLPYLSDLAELEYKIHSLYYTAEETSPDHSLLADPMSLTLKRSSDVSLFSSDWPVDHVREQNLQSDDLTPVISDQERYYFMIQRRKIPAEPHAHYPIIISRLGHDEYRLLDYLKQGRSLMQLSGQYGEETERHLPGMISHHQVIWEKTS